MLSKLSPTEIKRRPLLLSSTLLNLSAMERNSLPDFAVVRGSLECAKMAVAMGADPNVVSVAQVSPHGYAFTRYLLMVCLFLLIDNVARPANSTP